MERTVTYTNGDTYKASHWQWHCIADAVAMQHSLLQQQLQKHFEVAACILRGQTIT